MDGQAASEDGRARRRARRRHPFLRWPMMTSVAATIAILGIATLLIYELHNNVTSRAREGAENILRVVERDIARNVEVLDLSLQAAVEGAIRPDVMRLSPDLRQLVLFDRAATASGLGALVVFDANGRIILDSGGVVPRSIEAVTDREYFKAQAIGDHGLFISRPYTSRLIGREVVGLSRRLSNPDGTFGGVGLATIEVSYFRDLLSRLSLGQRGTISLVRDDGAIIVRGGPAGPGVRQDVSGTATFETLRKARSGTFRAVSPVDGIERLYTFTQVGDLPLTLSIGLAVDEVYGDWAREAFFIALALCLICAGIIALMLRLTKELRRRAAVEAALVATNANLARLSRTDALTGLGNRRLFDESLAREVRRAQRTRRRLSLILLDVDHFKRFNDRYGHHAGDEALTAIGGALAECGSRPADVTFRVGGEEFAVLLPETDLAGAMQVADRIRAAVRRLRLAHAGSPSGFASVSLGVVEVQGDDAVSAYERADAALYRAKQGGRDRAFAGEPRPVAA